MQSHASIDDTRFSQHSMTSGFLGSVMNPKEGDGEEAYRIEDGVLFVRRGRSTPAGRSLGAHRSVNNMVLVTSQSPDRTRNLHCPSHPIIPKLPLLAIVHLLS